MTFSFRKRHPSLTDGFTLVELSIVLIILGLLVGTVLSGKSLISSAELRAQIDQIDSYNVAARAFREKYFYLPGDLPSATAMQLNLYRDGTNGLSNSGCANYNSGGCGDGNGYVGKTTISDDQSFQTGEPHLFWLDLAKAGLISSTVNAIYADSDTITNNVQDYLPKGKLGNFYLYVWGGGVAPDYSKASNNDGQNYLTLSGVDKFSGYNGGLFRYTTPTIKIIDAYNIDKKIDDGMPQSGNVTAIYIGYIAGGNVKAKWAGTSSGGTGFGGPTTGPTPVSATTCYDNDGMAGRQQSYSLSNNGGNSATCALTFRLE